MTNPDYTAIMLLVDRSGSMGDIKASAQQGINEFLASQRNTEDLRAGDLRTVRLAQFDDRYELVYESTPAASVPEFKLYPRGTTALLDAIGKSIVEFAAELDEIPDVDKPAHVIKAIMTDGKENDSIEYTWPLVKKLITTYRDEHGWEILYLGANQDAIATAAGLGIRRDQAMTYSATDTGVTATTRAMDSYVVAVAAGESVSFTDEQRRDAIQ